MNIWEQWVYDAAERAKLQVFLPYKDVGVDAVITDGQAGFSRIQVKGSRNYGPREHGWWVINKQKLEHSVTRTDFWVFVWTTKVARGRLAPEFLAISPKQLLDRLTQYSNDSVGRFHLYLGRHYLTHFTDQIYDGRGITREERRAESLADVHPGKIYTEFVVQDWRKVLTA